MNKATFIGQISEKAGLDKNQAGKALDAAIEIITEALKAGDKVQMVGFGTFEVRTRAAHMGRNPSSGEPIMIPETKTPVFKAGKSLKDAL